MGIGRRLRAGGARMRPLDRLGSIKVKLGVTTLEEVISATNE